MNQVPDHQTDFVDEAVYHILDVRSRLNHFKALAPLQKGDTKSIELDFPDVDWFANHPAFSALQAELAALGFTVDVAFKTSSTHPPDHPADPDQPTGPHLVLTITRVQLIDPQAFEYPLLGLFRRMLEHDVETSSE